MEWHVALVGPLPPPAGGMANQTVQLAGLLRDSGISVELVRINAPYRPGWVARWRGLRALARLLPYLRALWKAAGRADVLHVMANSGWSWHLFAVPAIWIGRLRGRTVVVNYRGGEAAAFLQRSAPMVRMSMRLASALIVPSGYLQGVFARHGMQARVVPNVVDLARFAYLPQQPISTAPRLLVARNLEAIYDNATALQAFARVRQKIPSAHLVIAGSGPLRAELAQLAHTLDVAHAVTFTGSVDHAGMAALYANADIVLNPSTVDNTPNSVLEALASGVPVVSTDVGGVPFLVEHERSALLVPPRAPAAMAEAVLRLLASPSLVAQLRAGGLARARACAWPAVAPLLLDAYRAARSGMLAPC